MKAFVYQIDGDDFLIFCSLPGKELENLKIFKELLRDLMTSLQVVVTVFYLPAILVKSPFWKNFSQENQEFTLKKHQQ